MKAITDRSGNYIGDGSHHVSYHVEEIEGVSVSISKSSNTESVYVRYSIDNGSELKAITVRFSNHENNAVKFGDQLNGLFATKDEIMYHLGLKKRMFIPDTRLYISSRQLSKKSFHLYDVADKTIQEMYAMGEGADLSAYTGKLAKNSNILILGKKVEKCYITRTNIFGQHVRVGKYIYE